MRRRAAAAGAAVIGTAVAGYILLVRRWQLRWGATDEERDAALPGDDLIDNPDLTATRAIRSISSNVRISLRGLNCTFSFGMQ